MEAKWKVALIILVTFTVFITSAFQNGCSRAGAHIGIVYDVSDSRLRDCECLKMQVEQWQSTENITLQSTITLFATGDKTTADEPLLIRQFKAQMNPKVIEGRKKGELSKQDLLNRLKVECDKLSVTTRTPLYLAIKRALEDLRAKGCNPDSNCQLQIISDGEEESEKAIRLAFEVKQSKEPLPSKLDNEGIRVIFIGFAEVNGRVISTRNSQHADRKQQVWKGLFTGPDLVSFQPHCTKLQPAASHTAVQQTDQNSGVVQ